VFAQRDVPLCGGGAEASQALRALDASVVGIVWRRWRDAHRASDARCRHGPSKFITLLRPFLWLQTVESSGLFCRGRGRGRGDVARRACRRVSTHLAWRDDHHATLHAQRLSTLLSFVDVL
jgi:hypothetical protein